MPWEDWITGLMSRKERREKIPSLNLKTLHDGSELCFKATW